MMIYFYIIFMKSKVPELNLFLNSQPITFNQYKNSSTMATAEFPRLKEYVPPKFYYPISPIHSLDKVELPPQIPAPFQYRSLPQRPLIQQSNHHFYDLSKQILKGNYYIQPTFANKNRYMQHSGIRNIPEKDTINKKQLSYSIIKDPYLNNSNKNNFSIQQPQTKNKFIDDNKPKNKGIENISFGILNQIKQTNQNKHFQRIKTEETYKQYKQIIETKKINKVVEKRDHLEPIKNFQNVDLAELFIDILNHQQIDTSKEEYIQDWLKILKDVNAEPGDSKQKDLRRRIRDWRRKVQNLQQSIVSNYSEGNLNESMMRRELQQYQQKERNFQNKLNLLFQQTEELDFNLQKTTKVSKEVADLGGLIKLKNDSINLHREYSNKLNNLINDYQNKKEPKQEIYSYFS